jgi:hypothetical protein
MGIDPELTQVIIFEGLVKQVAFRRSSGVSAAGKAVRISHSSNWGIKPGRVWAFFYG